VGESGCQSAAHDLGEPVGVVIGVAAGPVVQQVAVVVPSIHHPVDRCQAADQGKAISSVAQTKRPTHLSGALGMYHRHSLLIIHSSNVPTISNPPNLSRAWNIP
jgi:hypothetical protein